MDKEAFLGQAETMRQPGNRLKQEALPLAGQEKAEDLVWECDVDGDTIPGSSGERASIHLRYDKGKCLVYNPGKEAEEVNFKAFLLIIGPNLMFCEGDKIFQKIYEKKMGRRMGGK
ncbi:MAG: hypothetical protein NTY33_04110 [Candidatus Moranbacteria bacterium]|nr:hypothetical protein [Candidatus Moranbacteria bacterium]